MIWLIGNKGMLGQEVEGLLRDRKLAFVASDREVDIREVQALRAFVSGRSIAWIINCSAYTNVEKSEEEEDVARSINATGAGNIALVASELGARLIHVSTDYVFDGAGLDGPDGRKRPYLEDDPVHPVGAYGRTKAEGEALVQAACARHFIIRTAWLYGMGGPNFVFTMLKLMKARDSVGVVGDQFGSPTWSLDLARAMLHVVESGCEAYGVYHFSGEGVTTWYEFAAEIQALGLGKGLLPKPCAVNRLRTDEYPTKTRRPAWSVLSKTKIAGIGVTVPGWRQSLDSFLESVKTNENPVV